MLNIGNILENIIEQLICEPLASEEVTTKNSNGFMTIYVMVSPLNFIFDRNDLPETGRLINSNILLLNVSKTSAMITLLLKMKKYGLIVVIHS